MVVAVYEYLRMQVLFVFARTSAGQSDETEHVESISGSKPKEAPLKGTAPTAHSLRPEGNIMVSQKRCS
jgi:hypothetical protein